MILTLKNEAAKRGLQPMVMTFDRHPLETIAPERAPGAVYPPSDKTNDLYRHGLLIHVVEFTREIASLSAREWMQKLHDEHNVRLLIVGYDNTFGSDGVDMSVADYQRLGEEIGIEVIEAPLEKGISSSAIRKSLTAGDLQSTHSMLGRKYTVSGNVVGGKRLGREIGFPTANVEPPYRAHLPANGVYSAKAFLEDGSTYNAVVNIGTRPTVSDAGRKTIEAHLIGFDGELYGSKLRLTFFDRLRDEQKFEDLAALKAQIRRDIDKVLKG